MSAPPSGTLWTARRGFGCAVGFVVVSLGMNQALRLAYEAMPSFADWIRANSSSVEFVFKVLQGCLWLITAYLFSGARSLRAFAWDAALVQRPTGKGWVLACAAISLGGMNLWLVQQGWISTNEFAHRHYAGGPGAWALFIVYGVFLSAFFEEVMFRGSLFHAFRQSYNMWISTGLVLIVQLYFHWGLVIKSVPDLLFVLAGGMALCAIREYTGTTWNCVWFHAAYNATVLRQWPLCAFGMLVMLVFLEATRPNSSPVTLQANGQAGSAEKDESNSDTNRT